MEESDYDFSYFRYVNGIIAYFGLKNCCYFTFFHNLLRRKEKFTK